MIKRVDNTGGGTAQPSDWTLIADGHNFSGPDPREAFSSGQSKAVEATQGDGNAHYDLSETPGIENYSQESLVCTGDGGHLDQQDRLTLEDSAFVTCTFTNKYHPPQPATITVNAGGIRAAGGSVGPLPNGAVFQAVPDTDDTVPGGPWECTISNGTCDIQVPGDGYRWTVSEKTPPSGWYLNTKLGTGGSGSSQHDYVFETTHHLDEGETYTVTADGDYTDGGEGWQDEHGRQFGRQLATSIDDPSPQQKCGLNIALVLDQSGSMDGDKQNNLVDAVNGVIDGLTGTPSRLAMYTFAENEDTAGKIGLTSTATAADAQPLHDFINGRDDPDGATNWDRGLSQVIQDAGDYDLVVFLTDGAPTVFGSDDGYGDSTTFRYVDEGVYSANAIKAEGTPVIGIGIGLASGAGVNLRAVTGPDEGTDYYTESGSSFVDRLIELASGACKKSLTIQKQIQDPDGHVLPNSADANGWTFTGDITGGTLGDFAATAEKNGTNGFTSADLSIPVGATADISLTEDLSSGGSGYSFEGATCTADGTKIDVNVSGTTASFDASAGQAISCVFTNKQPQPAHTVTVNKVWKNAISGDTATIDLGDKSGTSTATGGESTDNNVVSAQYIKGQTVTLSEQNPNGNGNKGFYYPIAYSCDGKDYPNNTDVSFPMPDHDVTCTVTNTNKSKTVTLEKIWQDGISGDTTDLSINGATSGTGANTSTSNGDSGQWTDKDHTATLSVPVGSTVTVAEKLGASNTGSYTSSLACTGLTPNDDGAFQMPADDVTCDYFNVSKSATVTLEKAWVDSIAGDTTTLKINGGDGLKLTSTGGTYTENEVLTKDDITVGSTVTLAEKLGSDNTGVYSSQLTCDNGVSPDGGAFRMPDKDVTCTYTNTANTGTVTLKKDWQSPVDGDTAGLQINGTTLATSTAKGTGVDDTNVAHATLPLGSHFTIGEALGTDNLGSYDTLSWCTIDGQKQEGTSFDMPTSGNLNVDCLIANTAEQNSVILQKTWVDGVDGDKAFLQINGSTEKPHAATSTSNGDAGPWTDPDNFATASVTVGTTVTLAETLDAGNAGSYGQSLLCTDGDGTIDVTDGQFRMPDLPVSCTFTNTAEQHTVTLQKTWVDGVDGDTANLVIDDDDPVTSTSNGQSGSWTDPDNKATKAVSTGKTVTVAEALGDNEGRYTEALSCTDGTNTWTDDSFAMPATDVTCTITNTLKTATLTLVKNVVNEHGGSAVPTDWTLTADGPTPISGATGTEDVTNAVVRIGSYDLGESGPDGYKLTGLTCTGANTSVDDPTVKLADGDDVTCTFTNTDQQASLTLVKKVDNKDGWGTSEPSDWTLNARGPVNFGGDGHASLPVDPGDYTLSETDGPSGYDFSSLVCKTAGGTIIDGVDVDNPVVPVALGDDVTCTFTNTAIQPTLTLVKKVDNGDSGGTAKPADWTLTADGPTVVDNVETGTTTKVAAGTYTMSESKQLPGYTTDDNWVCTGDSGKPEINVVSIEAGDDVTCTITNTAVQPTLTLDKKVDNGDTGGTAKPVDWTLNARGPVNFGGDGHASLPVAAGSYTLSESGGPPGYDWSSLVCKTADGTTIDGVDVDNPVVPVGFNQDVTCTFTNTAQQAHLTLVKKVNNDHGGTAKPGDWTLNADGPTSFSGASGTEKVSNVAVTIGTYQLSETDGPDGYTQTSLTCDNADGQVSSVKIGLGEDVTCTFTNTDVPASLTLVKHVENGASGATHGAGDWDLSADGPTPVNDVKTGTTTTVDAGPYTLSESGPDGYTASDWTCGDFDVTKGTVDVPLGADVICTITNTAKTPKLTLTKTVHNQHGGHATEDEWTLTADGPSSISGATGDSSVTNAPVKIGEYTLGESGPAGYDWTSLVCTTAGGAIIDGVDVDNPQLTLALGDDVTCAFTNTDQPALLTLQKIVDDNGTNAGKESSDWTLTATPQDIDGQGTVSGNGDPDSPNGVKDVSVFAGTYKLSEDGPAGFDAGDWVCPGGVVKGDLVTIPNGGSVLCQITNTAQFPHLTLIKDVENGDTGGTATDQDWTLTADGSASGGSMISGKTGEASITDAAVKVGTYDLSESTGPVGYLAGDWVCAGDGTQDGASVTLTAGQSATCTITNTAQPGTWDVSKTSDPPSGSTVQPGDQIDYTITTTHTGGVIPDDTVITDDLSGVLDSASFDLATIQPSTGTVHFDENTDILTWNTGPFEGTATLTYYVVVIPDAWGVTLKNVVTPPKGGTCTDGNDCTTEHYTPHWDLTKTSDPASGSVVPVGSTVTYTLHAYNDSQADVQNAVATDDISDVLDNATLDLPLPDGLTIAPDGQHLLWQVPDMAAGSAEQTASYSVTVKSDAFGEHLKNVVTPDDSGTCPPEPAPVAPGQQEQPPSCTTDHRVQDVDLKMVKTDDLDGAPVDSGAGDEIGYTLHVSNVSKDGDPATEVKVTDPMPDGLTIKPGSIDAPTGWDVSASTDTKLVATFPGPLTVDAPVEITFTAVVGDLSRSGPEVPFPTIENTGCVTSSEEDADTSNNCSTDPTKVKSVAVTAQALCSNNTPLVSYRLTPYNVSTDPKIAIIWWTKDGYAHRDASIPASDKAAILANGAKQVDYVSVPTGWKSGDPISGEQLWPGTKLDAAGNPIAWPGWTKQADGTWVLDPNAPGYDLRGETVVEVRINPSTASTELYPPATPGCNPNPPKTIPSGLPNTGSDVATVGLLGAAGLLIVLGLFGMILMWCRRRREDGRPE